MTLVLTAAALVLVAIYIHVLVRRVDVGLISLLAAELVYIAMGPNSALFGPIHLSPLDGVSFCLLLAGVIRTLAFRRGFSSTRIFAFAYLALFAISLMRGISANGLFAAGNEAREFIGALTATLYFLTVPADEKSIRRLTAIYLCFGACLCGIVVLAALGAPIGISAWNGADLRAIDGRYLPSDGAAALAVCGFFSLAMSRYQRTGIFLKLVPIIFIAFAVYLRHRTVWVMLLASIAALPLLDRRLLRSILPAALAAGFLVTALAIYGGTVQGLAGENKFEQAASNGQTFTWRLNGWKELVLDEEQTPLTMAIGKSIGSGYWRVDPVSYQVVVVVPHSEYIQEYLRVGVIGLLCIVLFAVRPIFALWRLNRIDPAAVFPSASGWALVVFAILVYGITYGIEPHSYALIGIANAIVLEQRQEATAEDDGEAWPLVMATAGEGVE